MGEGPSGNCLVQSTQNLHMAVHRYKPLQTIKRYAVRLQEEALHNRTDTWNRRKDKKLLKRSNTVLQHFRHLSSILQSTAYSTSVQVKTISL
jgi:hypothetical protein